MYSKHDGSRVLLSTPADGAVRDGSFPSAEGRVSSSCLRIGENLVRPGVTQGELVRERRVNAFPAEKRHDFVLAAHVPAADFIRRALECANVATFFDIRKGGRALATGRRFLFVITLLLVVASPVVARAQPSDIVMRPPKPSFKLYTAFGGASFALEPRGTFLGVSGLFDMQFNRKWGASLGASYYIFRYPTRSFSDVHAIVPEFAVKWSGRNPYAHAGQSALHFGSQVIVPFDQQKLPAVFLGPFVGFGGGIFGLHAGRAGVFGTSFDLRVGYRIPLGFGPDDIVGGLFFDLRCGVGFDFI